MSKNIFLKKLILLLLLSSFSFISCYNNEYDYDTIKFNVRKYLISEDLIDFKDIEDGRIEIDSIIKYPKYLYLENEINDTKKAYKNVINAKSEVKYLVLQIFQNEIDSLSTVYKNTDKLTDYYKCYYKIKNKTNSDGGTIYALILNEYFIPVNHFMYLNMEEEIDIPITDRIKPK